jgi:hypothetical protein
MHGMATDTRASSILSHVRGSPCCVVQNSTASSLRCDLTLRRILQLATKPGRRSYTGISNEWHRSADISLQPGKEHCCTHHVNLSSGGVDTFTVEAALIQCGYQLVCTMFDPKSCCGGTLRADIPIEVVGSQRIVRPLELPQPPPGWNPLVMESQVCVSAPPLCDECARCRLHRLAVWQIKCCSWSVLLQMLEFDCKEGAGSSGPWLAMK